MSICEATSPTDTITFPSLQAFQESGMQVLGAVHQAVSSSQGPTDADAHAAGRAAAAAAMPSTPADGTGFSYRGFGRYPCVSTIFDWRDGTLAPEADWAGIVQTELCVSPQMRTANFMLSERRNAADDDMTCDGSSNFARSQFEIGA